MHEPWSLTERRYFRQSICIQQGRNLSDQASSILGAIIMVSFGLNIRLTPRLTFSVLEMTVDSA